MVVEMNEWNPEQYLQFKSERGTQILVNRWPNSEVVGLDNSITMIEKARQDYPKQKWIVDNADNIDTNIK